MSRAVTIWAVALTATLVLCALIGVVTMLLLPPGLAAVAAFLLGMPVGVIATLWALLETL